MADADRTLTDVPSMDVDAIWQLVRLHLQHELNLAWELPQATPRAFYAGATPYDTVSELLRLAHLGAAVEAAARRDPGQPVSQVVNRGGRAWRTELGSF
jgi:hypothetical protein